MTKRVTVTLTEDQLRTLQILLEEEYDKSDNADRAAYIRRLQKVLSSVRVNVT